MLFYESAFCSVVAIALLAGFREWLAVVDVLHQWRYQDGVLLGGESVQTYSHWVYRQDERMMVGSGLRIGEDGISF